MSANVTKTSRLTWHGSVSGDTKGSFGLKTEGDFWGKWNANRNTIRLGKTVSWFPMWFSTSFPH